MYVGRHDAPGLGVRIAVLMCSRAASYTAQRGCLAVSPNPSGSKHPTERYLPNTMIAILKIEIR